MQVELSMVDISLVIHALSASLESDKVSDPERAEMRAMLIRLGSLKEVDNGTTNGNGVSRPSGSASPRPVEHGAQATDTATGSNHGGSDGPAVPAIGIVSGGGC